jgi:hypothetical protein
VALLVAGLALGRGSSGAAQDPVVLPIRELDLFPNLGSIPEEAVGTAALTADGRRLYLGLRYSYRADRRNLAVLTLGPGGRPVGDVRRYADSAAPLPEAAHASVQAVLLDEARRKLYLATTLQAASPPEEGRALTVYDLDAGGEPAGAPRSYESGNPRRSVLALAKHPRLDRLYLVGFGGAAVYVYRLDGKGEPQGKPQAFPAGGSGKYAVAVSGDGRRLYLGTYPDQLEVLDLGADGLPVGKARTFAAAERAGKGADYLRFHYAPGCLYLRRQTDDGPRLAVWPLNERGEPVGLPRAQPDIAPSTLAVDPANRRLWVGQEAHFQDAFTGKPFPDGVTAVSFALQRDGTPARPGRTYSAQKPLDGVAQTGAVLAVAANGRAVLLTRRVPLTPVGNRTRDYRLRVTVLETRLHNGQTPEAVPGWLRVGGGKPEKLGDLRRGQPSAWVALDPYLKGRRGAVPMQVSVVVASVPPEPVPTHPAHLRLRVEVARGDPDAGGESLRALTETVQGSSVVLMLPGYGSAETGADRAAAIALLSDHARRYRDAARAVALKPEERPRQFVVSCSHLMGGQGKPEQLEMTAEALAGLGFNTANAFFWGAIPPREIDAVLNKHGLTRRALAVYSPPSYFDFDADKMGPAALKKWADGRAASVARLNGGRPADVAIHALSDEPGWYFPDVLGLLRDSPVRLAAFRAYLKAKGLRPADLGAADWEQVFPVGRSAAKDLASRRLFYWTVRFLPESAAGGHRLARDALEQAFGRPLLTPIDWNNWGNRWYTPSPNAKIANNAVVGPDTAFGMMDWLESGRRRASTPWTEDWFADQQSQHWSFYGDLLRSSAALGELDFGSYVIGVTTGSHPAGASYRVLSLVGHGAKAVDVYSWGPEFLFPGNCWSESWRSYRPIADALRRLGRAERLLYPGRPERGKVALLLPGGSALWDAKADLPHYFHEMWSLHHALVHAGYTVDFIDEADVVGGALASRGYAALYLTAPNVPAAAQDRIAGWVHDGGTLAMTPGAAVADEYNEAADRLSPVLGVKPRPAGRPFVPKETTWEGLRATAKLHGDARLGADALDLYGPVEPVVPDGAAVLARFESGGAALTRHRHGKGQALAYGFFPGWQYWRTPDRTRQAGLPRGWGRAQRALAAAPARLADTPRPVRLSLEVVEACRLQSDRGIAVVLLNWADEPIDRLTVTVPRAGGFRNITSLERGPVEAAREGDGVRVTLPLDHVDVLLIE